MQLNLGCGFDRREGYLNVDSWPECSPDLLVDLELFPWPFETSSITRILARHVLEHLGSDLATFRGLWQELYRIAAPGCLLEIHLPYYKSAQFWSDPTHVRVYTPLTLQMLSKARNLEWVKTSSSNTKLAMMFDVDFEVVSSRVIWDSPWDQRLESSEITLEQLLDAERHSWNVVKELQFELTVRKGGLA
jgi:predicted SAM-dependent methyltransferase